MRIGIIGQGVNGLTSAYLLAKAGHLPSIAADIATGQTTSVAACAVWLPIFVAADGTHSEQVENWARYTYQTFELLASVPNTGVRKLPLHRVSTSPADRPILVESITSVGEQVRLIDMRTTYIWTFDSFVIDMIEYSAWLRHELDLFEVPIMTRARFGSFDEAFAYFGSQVVVNCSGMGARALCSDNTLVPAKGVVLLAPKAEAKAILSSGPFVVAPRNSALVYGALYLTTFTEESPTPAEVTMLREGHQAWSPEVLALAGISSIDTGEFVSYTPVAGLRPVRTDGVRLVAEPWHGGTVLHNYGHGGAGVTLSWGCARDICNLVETLS